MKVAKGRMVEGGRVIVPAAFRRAMVIAKGGTLVMELHGDERPARSALRRIQDRLKAHAPGPGEKLVSDELIEERGREAAGA
jgi:bifunctional DNA-binding transcriptional regulator/antitoxin component of YhaV-PrlF toxin-antitoxin module